MNNKHAAEIFLIVLCLVLLYFCSPKAHAEVTVQPINSSSVRVLCVGTTVDQVLMECREAARKVCPDGGTLSDPTEGPVETLPRWLSFTLQCAKPSESGV